MLAANMHTALAVMLMEHAPPVAEAAHLTFLQHTIHKTRIKTLKTQTIKTSL